MTTREAILEGSEAAADLASNVGLRRQLEDHGGIVDVFDMIADMGVALLFRPLDGLLGAFLPNPLNGIIITTERSLHIQRFTAAHELGHYVLGHTHSFDDENCIGFVARGGSHASEQEIAADAFAGELLAPKWLLRSHASRNRWSPTDLREPSVVYQLSLRLGISYGATCWALASNGALTAPEARAIQQIAPQQSKSEVLDDLRLGNAWADAWKLTEKDAGVHLLGSPDDVIRMVFNEHASAGATWDVESAVELAGLSLLRDESRAANRDDEIGSFGFRDIAVRGSGTGRLHLEERRQWDPESDPVSSFFVDFTLEPRERGLPRLIKRQLN